MSIFAWCRMPPGGRNSSTPTAGYRWLSRSVCCVPAQDHQSQRDLPPDLRSDRKMMREKLWREFFLDPSQWWDNRPEKVNPKYPDFRHKRTGQSLWLVDRLTPGWVEAELATMTPGLLQSHIFSWNVRLRRHLKAEDYQKALDLFQQIQREGMVPDKFTFVAVLNACSNLRSLGEGRRVHEQIIQSGCETDSYVDNCLVDMYAKCGSIEDAFIVFNKMRERNVVSWSAMIVGYVKSEQGLKALEFFREMQQEGVEPDSVTFVAALNACASIAALKDGRRVHEQIIQRGFEYDVYVSNCLVDMYAKCGSIDDAWNVFDKMRERDVVSWNAMIGGYVKSEQGLKALDLFRTMQQEGLEPNTITFVGALNACASILALKEGIRVHKQIIQRGCQSDVYVANCLIDMYARCGSIKDARIVFDKLRERNVVSWSAMIGGYAMHGNSEKAIELFEWMSKQGVEINQVTFTCLLSACSHGGLVEEGMRYFNSMTSIYNVLPTREHYACMVDLLGRAGRLKEAEQMTKTMPMQRDSCVWRSLLGACRVHGDIEMAERAAKRCWELDPEDSSAHVLLSNIYAATGKLDMISVIGKDRLKRKVCKELGRTWIEVENVVHSFVVDDKGHPQLLQIHAQLEMLSVQMNEEGYIPDTRFISPKETKECHSSDWKVIRERLWQEFFSDPSQWWDNRSEKVNPRYPDFKHKITGQSLWLDNSLTPPWVEAELATLAPGVLQLDIFSWNVRLRRHLTNEDYQKTLNLFRQMQREGIIPDKFTFVAVINACSNLRSCEEGRRVHEQIMQKGCECDIYVGSCLVDMYAKCGSIDDAWAVFNKMSERNVVSWSAMIVGYVKSGQGLKALELFREMHQEGVEPNTVTFVAALSACASIAALEEGRCVHGEIVQRGFESDMHVSNCLVDMYAKCGSIMDAWNVFNKMGERDVVSWNAMIGGYVKSEQGLKALELFKKMQQEEVEQDAVTFVGALNACASIAALREGRRVHKQIIRRGYHSIVYVATCLVDMYAKCGSIKDARCVFDKMQEYDVVSWNAMIGGYAMHGDAKKAIELFELMGKEGTDIDEITFTCLLSACSHGGLLEEGLRYFNCMSSTYNICATREHYACMVDLLGRAGRLEEAEEMTKRMPMETDSYVWRSLLNACRIHGNIEMAEQAAERCCELDPENASAHVLLSNIYAATGKWDRSAAIENKRLKREVWKVPGRTWLEVKNVVHSFVVDEEEHPQLLDIHAELERLSVQMNDPRYEISAPEEMGECHFCHS